MSRFAELADSYERMAREKRTWVLDHGKPGSRWPEHDINRKKQDAADLEEGASWFRRAAQRDERKQA